MTTMETAPATTARSAALRVGVVGKGGVGKTTVAGLMARAWAAAGRRVVAIDTDSNPNLGLSLGLTEAETEAVPVLPRGVLLGPGAGTSAAQLLEEHGRPTPAGVVLLSALRVSGARGGCTCSGHATVRSLLAESLDERADVVLVDMEAGLEHLSRSGGTLAHADVLAVVVEPSRKSVLTAERTAALAEELGIDRVRVVGNKVRDAEDAAFLTRAVAEAGLTLAGLLPYDPDVVTAERSGSAADAGSPDLQRAVAPVLAALEGVPPRP
jgi:CO dehydrogenase maturation factor